MPRNRPLLTERRFIDAQPETRVIHASGATHRDFGTLSLETICHSGEEVRFSCVICVAEPHKFGMKLSQPGVSGGRRAAASRVSVSTCSPASRGVESDLHGAITTAVVNQQHLIWASGLRGDRGDCS